MRYIHIIILLCVANISLMAGNIKVDRQWYVAGEGVNIDITLDDETSKVAYVELSDTAGVQAGDIISLKKGKAKTTFILPKALHSGYYQLSVYTRKTQPQQMIIPVINTLRASADDQIAWIEDNNNPSDAGMIPSSGVQTKPSSMPSYMGIEALGHIVVARVKTTMRDITGTLGIVGKEIHVFNAEQINDSTLLFHTYGISGKQEIVISAYDTYGKSLRVEVVSPYRNCIPVSLPKLQFRYNRKEVEARSIDMQRIDLERADSVKPAEYSDMVFNTKPILHYNFDEYRQFATVGESMLEFVGLVHQSEKNDMPELYVYTEGEGYSSWAALVLIDGMPTNDIRRLLRYDARRVHHINIYNDRFTLGRNNIYKGIVSIVTRGGNITNFPPDLGSAYIVYNFPH